MQYTDSPQWQSAAASVATKLGSASNQLLKMHDAVSEQIDKDRLYELAYESFWAAGFACSLLRNKDSLETEIHETADPLTLVTQAHDLLLEHTAAEDPPDLRALVLDVGTVRQRLRHYADRH